MEKKNNITEVVFVLDASGSMYSLTDDTIGGFNSMIDDQKQNEGNVLVSTVLFNSKSTVLHDRIHIDGVKEMTRLDYKAEGNTALMDAVGDAIHHISNIHKYIRPEDVPNRTLFVITTDGMENASHKYNQYQIQDMVESKKKLGWDFLFLGANIDAVETAKSYGIDERFAAGYVSDEVGTRTNFKAISKAMNICCRDVILDQDWKVDIEEDFRNRK